MANFIKNKWCQMVCISAIALASFSSCIKDDQDDCPNIEPPVSKVALKFDYTYNIKNADAFAEEVKNLNVYVFDENGKFLNSYIENSAQFEKGHTMEITGLKDGKYTFVCLARDQQTNSKANEDEMEFTFTSLTPGVSTINDLTEKTGKQQGKNGLENDKDFAALYTAHTDVNVKQFNEAGEPGNVVEATLSLLKCTKTYRIVLLPFDNEQTDFTADNFDVRIEGSAAWLDYQGKKVQDRSITYLPYNKELRSNDGNETTVEGKPIDKALVYDLSSSRMFERKSDAKQSTYNENDEKSIYNDKRIIITDLRDKENPKVIFDHSLPWFLALCGERNDKKWGAQEYLDRQDHYVLTFYIPDNRDYNQGLRVKVNGWVLNHINDTLGTETEHK